MTVKVNQQIDNKLQRSELLGIFTHPGTANDYLELVKTHIKCGTSSTIFYHNLHTLYLYVTSDAYKETFTNTTVIVDGMGVLFLYKLAGFPLTRDYRVTYVDFIIPLMETARDNGSRVFHIGQNAEYLEQALTIIRDKVEGIEIAGHHGYFDTSESSDETRQVIDQANEYAADLILVGLGSPVQEIWVNTNRDKLNASVVMTCGSCMDYVAGKVDAAPRWMSRAGFEAVYRIYADPKRLAFRYLVEPFLLVAILIRNRFSKNRKST